MFSKTQHSYNWARSLSEQLCWNWENAWLFSQVSSLVSCINSFYLGFFLFLQVFYSLMDVYIFTTTRTTSGSSLFMLKFIV